MWNRFVGGRDVRRAGYGRGFNLAEGQAVAVDRMAPSSVESPVLLPQEVPSLVDEKGRFKWGHRHPERMREATFEDAYREFDAQMALCFSILGRYPDVASVKNSDLPLEQAFQAIVEKYGIAYNIFCRRRITAVKCSAIRSTEI